MREPATWPTHRQPRAATAVLLALSFVLGSAVEAQQGCGEVNDYDGGCKSQTSYYEENKWRESSSELPPLPEDSNLRPIDASAADSRYEYLLDSASIARGSDDVMRYTVVVVSPNGARNVFHEGLRCLTDEVKTYAYASNQGRFRRSTSARVLIGKAPGIHSIGANRLCCGFGPRASGVKNCPSSEA